jgi:hypothetical protein
MRPKKSANDLEEILRETRPPATAVPPHFRQQLRRDLQTQAAAVSPPVLSRRWLLAPVMLLILVILAFWYGLPKTAVEPAVEINTTRPVPTPTPSIFPVNRDEALQIALTYAHRTDNKPIGGWLVAPMVDSITVAASLEAYEVALNRLGSFAVADFEGSNIIFLENQTETVWFVHLQGRWQPFGETAEMIEPSRYVGVLVNPTTGKIAAAGSSTVPMLSEPVTLPLADYPPQDAPYLVMSKLGEHGLWLVNTGEQVLAFDRRSPYLPGLPASEQRPDRCLYAWSEANGRFTDPCSGDEWELGGMLNLAQSTELWSNRNLDQYGVEIDEDFIYVHLDQIIFGEETVLEAAPTLSIGTPDQPQTNFEAVIEQATILGEQRQTYLTSQSGWFYTANEEYMPLDHQGEGTYTNPTFTTDYMVAEYWYRALGNGSYDQRIARYTDANGVVTLLTFFIDGYYVNLIPDNVSQAPQKSFPLPNEIAWVVEPLSEMRDYNTNEASVSAYMEQVDGRSHYTIQTKNIYDIPIPADTNTLGRTIMGEETNYVFDFDTGQLLLQENISIAGPGEQVVNFSRTGQTESWLAELPDDIALFLAQAQVRLDSSNLTWIAPTPTPDFNPTSAQVSDTQHDITVSVLDASKVQGEVAVRMLAEVGPNWGVIHAFPFFQHFISLAVLSGERPFSPTHSSGELVEVDDVTGGWREGSTHYFAGELIDGEELVLETAVDLTGIPSVITLPLTMEAATPGQSWSLDWPLSIGAAQLQVSEVSWVAETADGQAQLQLHVMDNSPAEIDIYCLRMGITDPWQEDCPLFEEDAVYTITVPRDEPIELYLRVSLLVNGFELQWQP